MASGTPLAFQRLPRGWTKTVEATRRQFLRNTHLLLVDDEENLRLSLTLIAKKAGYRVSIASNASDALEKIVQAEFGPDQIDVLVIDIQMPGMNGIELCEWLDRLERRLPVVIMSGYRT